MFPGNFPLIYSHRIRNDQSCNTRSITEYSVPGNSIAEFAPSQGNYGAHDIHIMGNNVAQYRHPRRQDTASSSSTVLSMNSFRNEVPSHNSSWSDGTSTSGSNIFLPESSSNTRNRFCLEPLSACPSDFIPHPTDLRPKGMIANNIYPSGSNQDFNNQTKGAKGACPLCQKVFPGDSGIKNLNRHLQSHCIHTQSKHPARGYLCGSCNKFYIRKDSFVRHLIGAKGRKPACGTYYFRVHFLI